MALKNNVLKISEELKLYRQKSIYGYQESLNDFDSLDEKMNNIDKNIKKSCIKDELLAEELKKNKEEIASFKKEIFDKETENEKILKKIIVVLDQIDSIYNFAVQTKNDMLVKNLDSSVKVIKKAFREIGFEEIPTEGEIFDPNVHECIEAVEDDEKNKHEIVNTVKKGYKYKDKILRVAAVIAVK